MTAFHHFARKVMAPIAYIMANDPERAIPRMNRTFCSRPIAIMSLANPMVVNKQKTESSRITSDLRGISRHRSKVLIESESLCVCGVIGPRQSALGTPNDEIASWLVAALSTWGTLPRLPFVARNVMLKVGTSIARFHHRVEGNDDLRQSHTPSNPLRSFPSVFLSARLRHDASGQESAGIPDGCGVERPAVDLLDHDSLGHTGEYAAIHELRSA